MSAPPLPVLPDYPASRWADTSPGPQVAPRRRTPAVIHALTLGAAALALAALPYKLFELDRFFVPKEVVLQTTALVVVMMAGRVPAASPRPERARSAEPRGIASVGVVLTAFLLASAAGAVLAPSGWMAARALGVSAAGVALFFVARAAGRAGWAPEVLRAGGVLVAIATGTALLQAYGVRTEYFSLNRAPGGTFGNRNFVAHLCAIGLPLLAYLALRARRPIGLLAATGTFAAAAAVLVLTRSRAAWLAAAASTLPFTVGVLRAVAARRITPASQPGVGPRARDAHGKARDRVRVGRAVLLVVAAAVAAGAAVRLPNALDWRSDSPYLDSARDVVNYREGSGRGRLKQWANSARLLAEHPVLGVGPGNWSVRYPSVAPAADPSLTGERTTANPWPSSDWVGLAAERGLVGSGLLAAAMGLLLWRAHRLVWRSPAAGDRVLGGTLGAVLAAALTAGAFDAVLLLAAPAFLAWVVLGALVGASESAERGPATSGPSDAVFGVPRLARVALGGLLAAGTALGTAHGSAMALYSTGRPWALDQAAVLAPGDYRIQLRAAQFAQQTGRCAEARRWGAAARELAPSAPAPARVLRACGTSQTRRSRATGRP